MCSYNMNFSKHHFLDICQCAFNKRSKEIEKHAITRVPLSESLQHITLELQLKLVTDTIKVQYQLLDLIHFIAIFWLYDFSVHQKTACFE